MFAPNGTSRLPVKAADKRQRGRLDAVAKKTYLLSRGNDLSFLWSTSWRPRSRRERTVDLSKLRERGSKGAADGAGARARHRQSKRSQERPPRLRAAARTARGG